jgi:hypothetical protein
MVAEAAVVADVAAPAVGDATAAFGPVLPPHAIASPATTNTPIKTLARIPLRQFTSQLCGHHQSPAHG